MSNRTLARMKPEEVAAIIDARGAQIQAAHAAEAELAERKAFAQQVEKDFGYSALARATAEEGPAIPADVVLLKSLNDLGIIPLARTSVELYKMRMARNVVNLITKMFGFPLMVSGIIAVAVYLIVGGLSADAMRKAVAFPWGAILGVGCFLVWAEHAIIPRREWQVTDFKRAGIFGSDNHLIPRTVFELAGRVREVLPKADFYVHELQKDYGSWAKIIESTWRTVNDPDPFLEVRYGGESYYIAVWNEPGFDGKLIDVI